MTGTPLVTIVTPCLNPGWRLDRCIASVAAQTYPHVEHVVVDGGSSDGTVDLLQKSDAIRWVSEPDSGQTNAINKGFAMARGDLLTWLNADDELVPDAIERSVRCFADDRVGWSYGDCELVSPDGTKLWVPPAELGEDGFDWAMPVPQPGLLVARWALERIGPLDETFHLSMDYDMCLRLHVAGVRSCYVPGTLARFEIHSASKTGGGSYVAFIDDGARAMAKSGRHTARLLALGQRCAHTVARSGLVASRDLSREIRMALATLQVGRAGRGAVRAGAYTAALELESRTRVPPVAALKWLAHPQPWRFRVTRRRLRDLFKTVVARQLRH